AQQALARMSATAVQIGYRLKAAEIAHILENSQPSATIAHVDYLPALREARKLAGRHDEVIAVGGAPGQDVRDADEWERALAAADPHAPPKIEGGDGGGV